MSFNITPVASGYQEIHPYSAMNIDSVKINTSLIMMKEWWIRQSRPQAPSKGRPAPPVPQKCRLRLCPSWTRIAAIDKMLLVCRLQFDTSYNGRAWDTLSFCRFQPGLHLQVRQRVFHIPYQRELNCGICNESNEWISIIYNINLYCWMLVQFSFLTLCWFQGNLQPTCISSSSTGSKIALTWAFSEGYITIVDG